MQKPTQMQTQKPTDTGRVSLLDANHQRHLEKALSRILNTDLAEETYAELLDGMPLSTTYREFTIGQSYGHPAMDHKELCPGALAKAREFRSAFDAAAMELPLSPLLAYQDTEIGSKAFHLRLLELLARACHQIGVHLFQIAGRNHHHEEHEKWRDEPRVKNSWDWYRAPIVFTHELYDHSDQYPNGVADIAGYWAEAKIFGGILVFDRGESETECKDVFIHARRRRSPFTIFPPTKEQFDQVIAFLLDEGAQEEEGGGKEEEGGKDFLPSPRAAPNDKGDSGSPCPPRPLCPLPILPSSQNRPRWGDWDAFAQFHIFRDRYERRVSEIKPRCERPRATDWPETGDEMVLHVAAYQRSVGLPVDEAKVAAAREGIKNITPSSPLWRGVTREPQPAILHVRDSETGEVREQTSPYNLP